MSNKTGIEWTDATWNPLRGCTRVSEGCRNCYAEAIAARFSGPGQPYHGIADRDRAGSKWTGKINIAWHVLDLPLRWRIPRRIFVNSMSDLFHEAADPEEIASIFAVMIAAVHLRGHTFQVLTKRAAGMRALLRKAQFWEQANAEASALVMDRIDPLARRSDDARATLGDYDADAPPPGIHLGVSVEHQAAADERIPELRATPAALRFLSCEPLLGPLTLDLRGIGWVICGGESGPDARPMHPGWAQSIRDQCAAARVPFFFKQWGEWCSPKQLHYTPPYQIGNYAEIYANPTNRERRYISATNAAATMPWHGTIVDRVGKRAAGATLDGREWREFPPVHALRAAIGIKDPLA